MHKNNNYIHYWKVDSFTNPINNRHYQEILWLNPTLSEEIRRIVIETLFREMKIIKKTDLDNNNNLIWESSIEFAKREIIKLLEELEKLTWEPKHIHIIADKCFTNYRLKLLIRKILWKEKFKRYVNNVDINYSSSTSSKTLENALDINHSIFILWWSLSDTYDIKDYHYNSTLSEQIKIAADDYAPKFMNKRFLWVCFWQQYIANLIWIANRDSSWIVATVKWPNQFWPSNCKILDAWYENETLADAMVWLSNFWRNKTFTWIFTRSWYVDFNLLKTDNPLPVTPLIIDEMSDSIVWWWSKNWKIIWIQFHPEISIIENKNTLRKELKRIIPNISHEKYEDELYMDNFELDWKISRDIWESFYVFAILSLLKDIKRQHSTIWQFLDQEEEEDKKNNDYLIKRLQQTTSMRVWVIMSKDTKESDWIEAIDKKWRLHINDQLDWKVNRWTNEISEILWVKSIVDMVDEHSNISNSNNYIIRDLWAWDWNSIYELRKKLKNKDVLAYWTWDYIYFDIFSAVKKTHIWKNLPHELLVLFTEKLVFKYREKIIWTPLEKLKVSLDEIEFNKDDKILDSSMTHERTKMFENEDEKSLSTDIINNFNNYSKELDNLRIYMKENLFKYFPSIFKNIYISKFNDLEIEDKILKRVDFQYAIRSTSHISWREYMKLISEYFFNHSKPWSIYLDNWIHQSYTSIPRIKELYEVYMDLLWIEINLIYDQKTNYFTSAVISNEFEDIDSFINKHIKEWYMLVWLKDAYRSTYFKLEYFIRNFIISNFKNRNVFWTYNKIIIEVLKNILVKLNEWDKKAVPEMILELINHIATNFNYWWVKYNTINMEVLNAYNLDWDRIYDIISKDIFTPSWLNINAKRKY